MFISHSRNVHIKNHDVVTRQILSRPNGQHLSNKIKFIGSTIEVETEENLKLGIFFFHFEGHLTWMLFLYTPNLVVKSGSEQYVATVILSLINVWRNLILCATNVLLNIEQ